MILSREDIINLIKGAPPLIESYVNINEQAQPNGFDLTLRDVAVPEGEGTIAASNRGRSIPELARLAFGGLNTLHLMPGAYIITYNEVVSLPRDVMALGAARSSLLRCGVTVHTAVWDAGYSGRSQSLMVVHNPRGFRVERNARMMQLVFFRLERETDGYKGVYQRENV
ncbi:MAG: deoxyuridine 5'-triphosphate nucleotidohydrolase [Chloroflexi bacterium]|nr:deoxyuridine 5'-triphosphate nucleotidohydrolase [Chloroflexota bacterium]